MLPDSDGTAPHWQAANLLLRQASHLQHDLLSKCHFWARLLGTAPTTVHMKILRNLVSRIPFFTWPLGSELRQPANVGPQNKDHSILWSLLGPLVFMESLPLPA